MCFFLFYTNVCTICFFFFSSRRRHTRCSRDWSSDVCSSDLGSPPADKIVILPPMPISPTGGPVPSPDGGAAQASAAGGWRLVWSDEFNGPGGTAPDPARWGHDTGGSGWGNSELEYYTNDTANAALDGHGDLAI